MLVFCSKQYAKIQLNGYKFMPPRNNTQHPTSINEKTSKRFITWLWMYLRKNYPSLVKTPYDHPENIKEIKAALKQITQDEIDQQYKSNILSEALYAWVEEDREQLEWLANNLAYVSKSINHTAIYDRQYIIGLFDLINSSPIIYLNYDSLNNYIKDSINKKKKIVSHLKQEWIKFSQPKKALEWFNCKEEPARVKVGWQVFKNTFPHLLSFSDEINNFEELIDKLESTGVTPADRLIFLSASKIKYSQFKSKEKNKGKRKQCNVEISLNAINRLKKLSAKYEISQGAVIEILLKKEIEKGIYIPERLKQTQDD